MIDLSPRNLEIVKRVLRDHVPGCEVRAFGSRATWTAKDYSDLDLALVGESEIGDATLARLREAFEDSSLPMRVDVLDWHGISPAFRKVIERDSVELPTRKSASSWRRTTLGACASLVGDKVNPANYGDLPYIGLEHIGKGTLSLLGAGTARDVDSTKTAFRAGDVLFGKLRPYFRKVVRPNFDGICSTDIWVVRPKAGVDAGYLFYLMASKVFVDFASQGSEGTRMPRAKWEHAARCPVSIPPMGEQRTIARTLGALDDKMKLNGRMAETLEEIVGMLFKSWFVGLDNPHVGQNSRPRSGNPTECAWVGPESWSGTNPPMTSLGNLFDLNPPRPLFQGQVAPYLDMANMPTKTHSPRSVIHRPYSSGTRFQNGDTLVARITPCLENGKVAYVDFLKDGEMGWGSTEFIVMRPKHPIPNEFAYFLAREPRFRQFAIKNMVGSSGRQRVSAEALSGFAITVPNEAHCKQFGNYAMPLMTRSGMLNRESRALAELRDMLLPKLISGEIRVQDETKAVA